MAQPPPPPAQPVLMTADQFQALGALYERTQVETRQLARLTQAAQSVDRCDRLVPENIRAWMRSVDGLATEDGMPVCNHCKQPGHLYRECPSRLGQAQHPAAPRMQQQRKQQAE